MRKLVPLVAALCSASTTLSAEQLSEISIRSAAYCHLWSREMTRIEIQHPTRSITADTDVILGIAKQHYGECLAVLPTLVPLPEELGSLREWLADMRDLLILRAGTEPATDDPTPSEKPSSGDEAWREACALNYRTWDPDSETVVRRGSSKRVRCPMVQENGEWVVP